MNRNYKILTENIRKRINPDNIFLKKAFTDELSTISYSDVLVFIRTAMKGIEYEYTQKSKDAGDKVKVHLSNGLSKVTFEYQGSVMTDTHIKGYSDIDLLVICEKFYTYDSNFSKRILKETNLRQQLSENSINKIAKQINASDYTGNALKDLYTLRLESELILTDKYYTCDIAHPKSIKIFNSDLKRFVDIVIANWYDDVASIINDKGIHRGVEIYNKDTNRKEKPDYPFLSIDRINKRVSQTNGKMKKLIRFLKNVKSESENDIDISSFDINAICYNINPVDYADLKFYELVKIIYLNLYFLCNNQTKSDNLVSVDGKEYIFKNNPSKLNNLKLLLGEVEGIYQDLNQTKLIYG